MFELWVKPFAIEEDAQQWRETHIWGRLAGQNRNGDRTLPGRVTAKLFRIVGGPGVEVSLVVGIGPFKSEAEGRDWLRDNVLSVFEGGELPDGKQAEVRPSQPSGIVVGWWPHRRDTL